MGILSPFQKNNIRKESQTSKNYPYELGKVKLSFDLYQNIDEYLIPFLTLLKAAVEDVEADIARLQAERKAKTKK